MVLIALLPVSGRFYLKGIGDDGNARPRLVHHTLLSYAGDSLVIFLFISFPLSPLTFTLTR